MCASAIDRIQSCIYTGIIMHKGDALATKTTHIFLDDPELVEQLEKRAKAEGRSKKAVVVRSLRQYLASATYVDRDAGSEGLLPGRGGLLI
jgi:predicted transcriptional regulator